MKKLGVLTLAIMLPSTASAQSVWMHNRSEMLLETYGSRLVISYLTPREGLSAQPGEFLIHGTLDLKSKTVGGVARVFSSKCGPAAYEVGGDLSSGTITLTGNAPIRDANCRITRFRSDKLVFTLVRERGTIDPFFIGEWSANQKTCDENEAQEGPILTTITSRGMGFYEEYCAFSEIRGNANLSTLGMTCSIMDSKSSVVKGLKRLAPRMMEVEFRDGPSAGAKRTLYKCPIDLKDPATDPSTPRNIDAAEEAYFDRISDEANQTIRETMANWPRQPGGARR
jgi:hypothetical protein